MVSAEPPLTGLLAVEHGERLGAAVCGSILARLGAEVAIIEHEDTAPRHKWLNRAAAVLDKRSLLLRAGNTGDQAVLRQLLQRADVVVTSSDLAPASADIVCAAPIVCDITAYGRDGPLAGVADSDALVQAAAGLADTTGDPDAAPGLIGIPFCEVSAGIYAAAAILVAQRVRRERGFGQHIDIALYDCAIGALSTFLPFHAAGKPVTRSGNRHSLAAPWNAYRGSDGWVLICTATDEQWRRLCTLIGASEFARRDGFVTNAQRIMRRGEVDEVIQRWTAAHTVAQCIEQLSGIDIACGPILALHQLAGEPNLVHRRMIRHARDAAGTRHLLPGSPLAASLPVVPAASRVPAPGEHRSLLQTLAARPRGAHAAAQDNSNALPLAGLRVLEIGQYTTAPLVARQLGMLGAQVYKIEPPGGEGSRAWPPLQGDRGYFFALSNNDKRSLELDLRDKAHRAAFVTLLAGADVLVENLKPGSLARLGFGPQELRAINPRLIYCGISGFGAASVFPGRPAFDTVVQAMSGFMDVTRSLGAPTKAGISAADIVGGEYGLLAILAALEIRDQCGEGLAIDISMQDAAVSATGSLWNTPPPAANAIFLRCKDGYLCVEAAGTGDGSQYGALRAAVADLNRAQAAAAARAAGFSAAPVCSVSEAATSGQTVARKLIIEKSGDDGRRWPLLGPALRLGRTPPRARAPIGALGEANAGLGLTVKSPGGG